MAFDITRRCASHLGRFSDRPKIHSVKQPRGSFTVVAYFLTAALSYTFLPLPQGQGSFLPTVIVPPPEDFAAADAALTDCFGWL